jgi:hypothetical protein
MGNVSLGEKVGELRSFLDFFGKSKIKRWTIFGTILEYVGATANIVVVKANGGMPVSSLGQSYTVSALPVRLQSTYVPLVSSTKFPYLADIVPISETLWCSPGDMVMWAGLAVVIFSLGALLADYFANRKS